MANHSDAQITVVYPITELRAEAADCLRTWTHGQTLARERYRVVAAFDGTDASQHPELLSLLGPGDALLPVPGANTSAILNAAAARAGTPWLLFTEGHCMGDPGCLAAVARWIADHPGAVVGNVDLRHRDDTLLARISARWYDTIEKRWRAPDDWPRVIVGGFAIRADVFSAVGGFEPEYRLFAPPLMSARLHARGIRIEVIPGASVLHVDVEDMPAHHAATALFARGEFAARARVDPTFMERYFGHAQLWANQLRERPGTALSMMRAVLAAGRAHPGKISRLATALRPLAAPLAGIGLRVALHRFVVRLDELAIEHVPLPAALQWRRFNRAHARVVHLTRLESIRHRPVPPAPPVPFERWSVDRLGPDRITGVHGLEEYRGHRFRWTEPVALLRLAPSEDDYELRIETGGIRGDPLACVIAVVVEGRVLPRELISSEAGGTLVVRLPAPWSGAARAGIVLVCSALAPARAGVPDHRLLGLPIVSVASAPLHGARDRMAAA